MSEPQNWPRTLTGSDLPAPSARVDYRASGLSLHTESPSSSGAGAASGPGTSGSVLPERRPPGVSLRVYSPSATQDWVTCPMLRVLKRSWRPREVTWDPARALGTAVHEGYFAHLRAEADAPLSRLDPDRPESPEAAISNALVAEFQEGGVYTLEGLIKLATRGVQTLIDHDLFRGQVILAVDTSLSESRPDMVSRDSRIGLGVTDLKVSQTIGERWRTSRMSEYEVSDQLWHYAWEVGETMGEPMKWACVVQLILAPKPTVLTNLWSVDPWRLAYWLQGATQHWKDMQDEDEKRRIPAPRWMSCRQGKYGECAFFGACHVYNLDPNAMMVGYDRVEGERG